MILVTGGGTIIPMEKNTVRYIDFEPVQGQLVLNIS